jgi:flagellar motor switch protein FliN/FliY
MSDDQGTPPPEDQSPEEASTESEDAGASDDAQPAEGEQASVEEAEALAAAMAAINQVQGVADSAAGTGDANPSPTGGDAQPFSSPEFGAELSGGPKSAIEMLSDVHMDVRIELGRTNMYVEDVLRLNEGAVVELDKLAGDPVDVFVNDRRVARGEVLVLNDMFCVRINEVVDISQDDQ